MFYHTDYSNIFPDRKSHVPISTITIDFRNVRNSFFQVEIDSKKYETLKIPECLPCEHGEHGEISKKN